MNILCKILGHKTTWTLESRIDDHPCKRKWCSFTEKGFRIPPAPPMPECKPAKTENNMSRFRKKPVEIEAITWSEFVEYGLKASPDTVHNGFAWSFDYKGNPVTHENDICYIISALGAIDHFTPKDILIADERGRLSLLEISEFEATYEKV